MAIKRASYEIFLVTVVVLLSVMLAIGIYRGQTKVEKGRLLMHELSMMRAEISRYKMTNRENPPNLGIIHGVTIDPFGAPYGYDTNSGWVKSTSRGYELW